MKPNNTHAHFYQPIQMMTMSKMFSKCLIRTFDNPLFRVLPNDITRSFKMLSSRVLKKFSMILVLSALLSACGGGGGSADGGGDTTTLNPTTTPTLSVLVGVLTVNEDFTTAQLVATATNATNISFSESTTGVVSVRATANSVNVSSVLNANGQTTLTMTAMNGSLGSPSQVIVVDVRPINDPPTLMLSTTALTLIEDFDAVLIGATSNDVDGDTLTLTVTQSNPSAASIRTSTAGIIVSNIANAHGQTTLTITVSDDRTSISTQVVVAVTAVDDPPTLSVSTNNITTLGGFTPITINTTANDVEEGDLSFTVTESSGGVVNVTTSTNTIVLTAILGASGATTLTVIAANSSGLTVTQTIAVTVNIVPSAVPVLVISTNLIRVQEDFSTSLILRTTATDSDGDTIILSVSSTTSLVDAVISTPVSGMSTLTNMITLTAVANAYGTVTLTIFATDIGGQSISTEVVVVVMGVNDTPTLTIPTATLIVAEDFMSATTLATAVDVDSNTLTLTVTQSTNGVVTVSTQNSSVRISSIADVSGQITLTMTISDGFLSSTAQVVVRVVAVNDPPILTVSTTALTLGEDFEGSVLIRSTRTDIDGDTLTLSVTASTSGLVTVTTSDAGVRVASIRNAFGQTILTISVNDGTTNVSTQVAVIVTNVNDTPTLTIPAGTFTALEDFSDVRTLATADDVDGNPLILTVTQTTNGVVTVSTSGSGVQLTSILNAHGQTTLTINVSDGRLDSTAQVVVNVMPVNDTPTISVSTTVLTLIEDFSLNSIINVTIADIEGDTLTFSVTESTLIAVTTSGSSVRIASIPNANGQTTLTISVSDSMLIASTHVAITVIAVNDTPTLAVSTNRISTTGGFTPITIATTASDADEGILSFSVQESTTGVVRVTTSTKAIVLNAIPNMNGQTTLTVTTIDNTGITLTQIISISVTISSSAQPMLMISTDRIIVTEDFRTALVFRTTITDADSSDTLTLSVSSSKRLINADISTPSSGVSTMTNVITLSAIANANGTAILTVLATDNGGQTAVREVLVTVTAVNDTPTLNIPSATFIADEDFTGFSTIATAINVDGDALTFSVVQSTSGVVAVTTSAAGVQVASTLNANGQTTLTITVSDGIFSDSTQVIVIINPINDPPTLIANPVILDEDFAGTITVVTASDVDGDALSFIIANLNTKIVSSTFSTSSVSVSGIADTYGQTTLSIFVSDGKFNISTQVAVIVNAVNDTPTISLSTDSLTLNEDFESFIQISAILKDVEGDTLTLSVTESTTNVVKITTSTSDVRISSILNAVGQTTLTLTVSDGKLDVSTQVAIVLVPLNDTPTLSVSTTHLTLNEDFISGDLILVTQSDIDGDTLTLSVTESPTGVVMATTSASGIRLSSRAHINGQTTLAINLFDGTINVSTQVVVVVKAVNDPATITIPSTTLYVFEDFVGLITIATAIDTEGDPLTFRVTESTTGVVTVTTSTLGVRVNSRPNGFGQTTLSITVNDGTDNTLAQVAIFVTSVNDTPTLTVSTSRLSLLGGFSPITIHTTASDSEEGILPFDVQISNTGVLRVTTSTKAIVLNAIPNVSGQTTITVRTIDTGGLVAVQTIAVNITILPSATPTLTVSTNFISVLEDFRTPVVINASATDSDGGILTIFVNTADSTNFVNVALTALDKNQVSITLSPIVNFHGSATLTVIATDPGGVSVSEQIALMVTPVDNDPVSFAVSNPILNLFTPGGELDRHVQTININNPDIQPMNIQWQVTSSGDPIFSHNPAPVVSFTTNVLSTVSTLTSATQTAQLYFTIAPNSTGSGTLTLRLSNLTRSEVTMQTVFVHVASINTAPVISRADGLQNIMLFGGRLYANSVIRAREVTPLLAQASDLGGHLININTVEEFNFVNSPLNPIMFNQSWIGLVLPQQKFPGELFWVTNNSTVSYGFGRANGNSNFNMYPGHYPITWNPGDGLDAHRRTKTATVFNWTIYDQGRQTFYLLEDQGDPTARHGLYEFPRGLPPLSNNPTQVSPGSSLTLNLVGFDLDGDAISSSNWTVSALMGTATLNIVSQSTGIQMANLVYTAPTNFTGQTTVVVTLQVNGLGTTAAVPFFVTQPTFALESNSIVLSENSDQTIRNRQIISDIRIPELVGTSIAANMRFSVTQSGDPIFTASPSPIVSFSSTNVIISTTIDATAQTAQLYFTIIPDRTGTGTLTVNLTNLANSEVVQRTLVVQVNPMDDVPPAFVPENANIHNIVVFGGHLYANSVVRNNAIDPFLAEIRALGGGHLIALNTVEEDQWMQHNSGLNTSFAWIGLALRQVSFPGELFLESTNNRIIPYAFSSANGYTNIRVYPGHHVLDWNQSVDSFDANAFFAIFHWVTYDTNGSYLLSGDDGESLSNRVALYEFPNGITSSYTAPARSVTSSITVQLRGYDLNGEAISTANWSFMDPNGGTARFTSVLQRPGAQTVDMVYTPLGSFDGHTTVVVNLQVGALSTSTTIPFIVDGEPIIALSTRTIVLNEEFNSFVIATTVTDLRDNRTLPFTVRTASTNIVTITTSANSIQLSSILNRFGTATLTVQATDSALQTASALIVVNIQEVNDLPTLIVSTNNVSLLGGFSPFPIDVTASDIEDGPLPLLLQNSNPGLLGITTTVNGILLTPIAGASGQTVLSVRLRDSANAVVLENIIINVTASLSSTPVLAVSTNLISVQEDFTGFIIRTTATDTDPGPLLITVGTSTRSINAVVSTNQEIILSGVPNFFGTTTLTVYAIDTGRLFTSTEIVIIVASVNDTPTIIVTPTLSVDSVNNTTYTLSVLAMDIEDGILPFSISTGQGIVNTAITTTSIAISRLSQRLDLPEARVLLTLFATDTNNISTSTVINLFIPSFLVVTTGIKTLDFVWGQIPSATHYQLQTNAINQSGFVDLSTTGVIVSPNSTIIRQTSAQVLVSLHQYIPRVNSPQFGVISCDDTSCGSSFSQRPVILTNLELNSLIGRIQSNNIDDDDRFGTSISLSDDGNVLAVGAPTEDGSSQGINGQVDDRRTNSGAAYVFRRNGGLWVQEAYIKAFNNTTNGDQFGWSLSLSGDGNILAVSANGEDRSVSGAIVSGVAFENTGAVYLFSRSTSNWVSDHYIKETNQSRGDQFGHKVVLSKDGRTLAVGVPLEDGSSTGVNAAHNDNAPESGAVFIFQFRSVSGQNRWELHSYIKASNAGRDDRFGDSIALSDNGETLAVGAPNEDGSSAGVNGLQNDNAPETGAVYVFRLTNNIWSQQAYIKPSNPSQDDRFGLSVSLSGDGNLLSTGAPNEDGSSTAINTVQNDNTTNTGAVYVFRIVNGVWSQQAYVKASNAGANDGYGQSVSLSRDGNLLAVGALAEDGTSKGIGGSDDNRTNDAGAAYLIEFRNGIWTQKAYIKSSNPLNNAAFGGVLDLSADGGTLAITSREINTRGAVYLY